MVKKSSSEVDDPPLNPENTEGGFTVWQPIETAPKDGAILVFGKPSDLVINDQTLGTASV